MNQICLIGRLTETPTGKPTKDNQHFVVSFSLAVARGQETDFIYCTAWDSLARWACKWLEKGRRIGLTGSLRTHTYTDADGKKRTSYDVVADRLYFADSPKAAPAAPDSFEDITPAEDGPF